MNKYLTFTICLCLIFLPVIVFGQTNNADSYNKLLQFLKGDGAFEKWFMEVFTKLDNSVQDSAQGSALVGRAIGGMGALMYLGYMGWPMAAGDREWEITPMLKPILIGFTKRQIQKLPNIGYASRKKIFDVPRNFDWLAEI